MGRNRNENKKLAGRSPCQVCPAHGESLMEKTACPHDFSDEGLHFETLPDVVLGKIMSHLHWKEKQLLAIASPRISVLIETPLAWTHFDNDRNYAFHHLYQFMQFSLLMAQEMAMIHRYGKYFKHCKLWLHSLDAPDNVGRDESMSWGLGNALLQAVSAHCRRLQSLCIVHPSDANYGDFQNCTDYINSLQNIVNGQSWKCSLSLRNLFYSKWNTSVDSSSNCVIANFLSALDKAQLLPKITCLDISHCHALIPDQMPVPVNQFTLCSNLTVLKCPIHVLDTLIVSRLMCQMNVTNLYLVSDEQTNELGFREHKALDWSVIFFTLNSAEDISKIHVHYVFKNRPIDAIDIVLNPFCRSVVFSNLTCSISAHLLRLISDLYGQSLETIAFCSNHWEFLMNFTDLHLIDKSFSYLGQKCRVLTSFISCLRLPSSAILNLVKSSQTLRRVGVYRDSVSISPKHGSARKFQKEMARSLPLAASLSADRRWWMLRKNDDIFEVAITDPILFDTCFRDI